MKYLKVFTDFREFMEPLSREEKGSLFEAMLDYAEDGREPELSGNERFVWAMARRIIDREAEIYQGKVESAGKARGSRRKRSSDTKEEALVPEPVSLVSDEDALVPEPVSLVSDKEKEYEYENEYENEKDNEYEKEKEEEYLKDLSKEYMCVKKENAQARADTHIPERAEIESYCRERGNDIDAGYFYDYYAATGWKVGRNPVQDWKALVRAWEKRDAQRGTGPGPLSDTVQSVLGMAQANRRTRQRNTLLNYRETPEDEVTLIHLDLNEL